MERLISIYKEQWQVFVKRYIKYLVFYFVVSVISAMCAFQGFISNPELAKTFFDYTVEIFEKKGMTTSSLTWFDGVILGTNIGVYEMLRFGFSIFINNLLVITLLVISGFLAWSIFPLIYPLFTIIMNSILIGGALAYFKINGHQPGELFVKGVLPHGVTEFLAIYIAASLGTYIGVHMISWSFKTLKDFTKMQESKEKLKDLSIKVFYTYVFVLIPLVAISAFIECVITPMLL
ncbi:stage II sporulation protein M [Bacillus bombysepticus]|uniref:stage II sporulation protein M n=1 Tax=Bacillus bombysepticus TaxID=658666 RepID=UPI003016EF71